MSSVHFDNNNDALFIGVDVGTESARAALVTAKGQILETAQQKITIWNDLPGYYEQSSENIWSACCSVVKAVVSGVDTSRVKGVGFDATCSLVVLDKNGQPMSVTKNGETVLLPGSPIGLGLTSSELGLQKGTLVGASMIDAHAGTLALLGCQIKGRQTVDITRRLALISGTSTCLMLLTSSPVYVDGVWGPYMDVLLPGYWLLEGGQSATGKLIDHIVYNHPAYKIIQGRLDGRHIQSELSAILDDLCQKKTFNSICYLTKDVHVWPDFHGNRSPLADPSLKGMISGLTLANGEEDLALLYLAALQSLAYSIRHVIEVLESFGTPEIQELLLCGGLSKSKLWIQTIADATGLPVIIAHTTESVLLGSAMLAAAASGHYKDLQAAVSNMAGNGDIVHPDSKVKRYHDKKFQVFSRMVNHQKEYRKIMNDH